MAIKRVSRAFKDISLSFKPHPVTKDLQILKNADAIRRSVRNIVQTIPTERFFNSLLGSDVQRSLFEFVDFGTASTIRQQIAIALDNFEPRVENVEVAVDPNQDDNAFDVEIEFTIRGRQDEPPQNVNFLLQRTR